MKFSSAAVMSLSECNLNVPSPRKYIQRKGILYNWTPVKGQPSPQVFGLSSYEIWEK